MSEITKEIPKTPPEISGGMRSSSVGLPQTKIQQLSNAGITKQEASGKLTAWNNVQDSTILEVNSKLFAEVQI